MTENSHRRTMRRNVRELPGATWVLVGGVFINRFASFAVVFLVLYLINQGFSLAQAGLAVAAYGGGEMVASVVGGHLADRLGRRTTIAISMYASAAAVLALSQVESYGAIVAVAFLAGLAFETHRPAGLALVSDMVEEEARVTAFAVLRLAANLGFAAGSAVAGFLADHSFLWVFAMDAATSVLFGTLALLFLPEGQRSRRREEVERRSYRGMLAHRPLLMFLVASVAVAFVYFQVQATLPVHVVRQPGLTNSDYGLLLALNGVLVVLLELPLSSITMRLPARRMIALSFALVGIGFGLTAVAHSLPLLMASVLIWTTGEMIGVPVGHAYLAALAPSHMRGRYQGLYGLALGWGSIIGPSVGPVLFAADAAAFWLLCGVLGLIAAAIVLATREGRVAAGMSMVPEPPDLLVHQARSADV